MTEDINGQQPQPALPAGTVSVPADLQPLIPDPAKAIETAEPVQSAEEVRAAIEAAAEEATEVARSSAKVDLEFPAIGFIDPVEQLEKMRRIVASMPELDVKAFPDKVRSALIAWNADKTKPEPTDEDIALALYIKRTVDTPLTPEDVEAKATGKKPSAKKAATKEKKRDVDDILGGI